MSVGRARVRFPVENIGGETRVDYIEHHYSGPVQRARLEKGRNGDIRERRTMDD